jgi:small-conductance mechanosensitive channel
MTGSREWLVALTGVAFVVLGIISFVVGGTPPTADDPVREIVDHYVDGKDSVEAAAFIGVAATALLIFFGGYLRKALRARAQEAEMLSLVAFIGVVIVAVGFAIDTTIGLALSEAADDIDPAAVQALQALRDTDFVPLALGSIVFLTATGLSVIRSGVLPRWLGWVMLVLGVVGVTPIGFVSAIGAAIMVLVLSIVLSVRARAAEGTRGVGQPAGSVPGA